MSSETTNETDLDESLRDVTNGPSQKSYQRKTTVVARTIAKMVVPIILLVAISLLFQGHNLPGGGFIGGVLTATAFVIIYVIFGLDYIQDELLKRDEFDAVGSYRWLFSIGLAIALLAGLAPILFGFPFLTQGVLFLENLPLFGTLEVASAFAFDIGVYFVVVGALLTVLAEVGAE